MLTTGNTATDALFQSGAHQNIHIYLFDAAPATEITDADIMQNGVTIRRSSVGGNTLEVGTVIAADCTIQIYNRGGKYDNTQFLGNTILVGIIDDTSTYGVNLGTFRIDDVTEKNGIITIKAMDCMAMLDIPYTSGEIIFPANIVFIMNQLRNRLMEVYGEGEIVFNQDDFGPNMSIFPNDVWIHKEPKDASSYRQIFSWCLQLIGKSAYADPTAYNTIRIGNIPSVSGGSLYKSHRISSTIDKNSMQITSVTVNGDKSTTGAATEYNVEISDNYLYANAHALIPTQTLAIRERIRTNILNELKDKPYYPMTATVLPCPLYMPFDLLRFYTDESNYKETYITDVAWTLNKNVQLTSVGISTTTNSYTPNSPVTARQAEYIRNAVKTEQGDYVTETGIDGAWSWRKWNSGVLEQWGVVAPTAKDTGWDDWGSRGVLYIQALDCGTFPIDFVSAPNIQVTLRSRNIPMQANYNSSTKHFSVEIARINQASGDVNMYIFALGRWK